MSLLPPMGEGSLVAAVFTLVSSAMGAGCLSLPFMFRQSGVLLGLVMLFVGAALAHLSLVVLMSCARYTNSDSMSQLVALISRGKGHRKLVDVVIAVYGVAAVLCYLMFIGDFFSGIARSPFLGWSVSREALIVGIAALVVWPLSLLRGLTALRHVCVLSVGAICITSLVVACKTPAQQLATWQTYADLGSEASDGPEIRWWNGDPKKALQSFSIALFAFSAHTNAVPVASSLSKADGSSIWLASLYSVSIEFAFYAVMGIAGYLSFRSLTKQDFILNYGNDDVVMFLVRCVYGIVVCVGAPINLSPAASSILELLSPRSPPPTCLRPAIVTLAVGCCVCVAVCSEQIADVIGLCGASFGSLIALAWPALIYRRVLFDLHPPWLARALHAVLAVAAAIGVVAFVIQAVCA